MTASRQLDQGARHIWRPYCQHRTAPSPLPSSWVLEAVGFSLQTVARSSTGSRRGGPRPTVMGIH